MSIILLSLGFILAIYFLVALSPIKLCAICSAVSVTWIVLLVTYVVGIHSEITWIGILMGGSVAGLMYRLDAFWKSNDYSGTWFLKLSIILFGFLSVYVVLIQDWLQMLWLAPIVVISASVGFMLLRKKSEKTGISSDLQDKLDHCCD